MHFKHVITTLLLTSSALAFAENTRPARVTHPPLELQILAVPTQVQQALAANANENCGLRGYGNCQPVATTYNLPPVVVIYPVQNNLPPAAPTTTPTPPRMTRIGISLEEMALNPVYSNPFSAARLGTLNTFAWVAMSLFPFHDFLNGLTIMMNQNSVAFAQLLSYLATGPAALSVVMSSFHNSVLDGPSELRVFSSTIELQRELEYGNIDLVHLTKRPDSALASRLDRDPMLMLTGYLNAEDQQAYLVVNRDMVRGKLAFLRNERLRNLIRTCRDNLPSDQVSILDPCLQAVDVTDEDLRTLLTGLDFTYGTNTSGATGQVFGGMSIHELKALEAAGMGTVFRARGIFPVNSAEEAMNRVAQNRDLFQYLRGSIYTSQHRVPVTGPVLPYQTVFVLRPRGVPMQRGASAREWPIAALYRALNGSGLRARVKTSVEVRFDFFFLYTPVPGYGLGEQRLTTAYLTPEPVLFRRMLTLDYRNVPSSGRPLNWERRDNRTDYEEAVAVLRNSPEDYALTHMQSVLAR